MQDFLPRLVTAGKQRLAVLDPQRHGAADEGLAGIAHQRAGQQAGFGEHLESVAHAEHGHAAFRLALDAAHDRAVRRHRAGAQIIAIGKTAGQGDEVEPLGKVGIAMPDAQRGVAGDLFDRHRHVAVAIRAGKGDDGGAEAHQPTFSMR